MVTMTIRLPEAKHARLRLLAERHGVSLNKLVEEWASVALAQFDAETRFRARSARGSPERGLRLLDERFVRAPARRRGAGRKSAR
ncbi:MAG: toxin-antitoxin system HicB family antitoxin [Gemmatimonadetes bacterium]|nr:toxin-antitoxin system HicB family antitoxin [Gemmatimonadota bacterium]